MATMFDVKAQQLSSGAYTVSISEITESMISWQSNGENFNGKETYGTYTIYKNGKETKSQKFTFTKLYGEPIILNIKESDSAGNTLTYDEDAKKFDIAGNEYKAKKTNTKKDIILSGILAYAQWLDEE
jgi:hypothetical protein